MAPENEFGTPQLCHTLYDHWKAASCFFFGGEVRKFVWRSLSLLSLVSRLQKKKEKVRHPAFGEQNDTGVRLSPFFFNAKSPVCGVAVCVYVCVCVCV